MYIFVVGMEKSGTKAISTAIKEAAKFKNYTVHKDTPTLSLEAKFLFQEKDYRSENLREKINFWRNLHKKNSFVCESNHRLSFFINLLMKEFGEDCKIIFMINNVLSVISSQIESKCYYKEFIYLYPEFFIGEMNRTDFNEHRISPPLSTLINSIGEAHLWEWLETYKFARKNLCTIPKSNRLLLSCEEIEINESKILNFLGKDLVNKLQIKKPLVKSRSKDLDLFINNELNALKSNAINEIKQTIMSLPVAEKDIIDMDTKVLNYFTTKVL